MNTSTKRKLVAIVFTDIVGFSKITAKDEKKALELLDIQRQLFQPIIDKFGGTLHKEIGDGLLLTFNSVSNAIQFSIKIQKIVKTIDKLSLRISIHEGEVSFSNDDVLGDDVNIASRLEPYSPVNGIVISGKVQQNILSLKEYKTQYIGTPKLKGISQNIKIYCITSHGLPKPKHYIPSIKTKNYFKIVLNISMILGLCIGTFFILNQYFSKSVDENSIGVMLADNYGESSLNNIKYEFTEDLIISLVQQKIFQIPSFNKVRNLKTNEIVELRQFIPTEYFLLSNYKNTKDTLVFRIQLVNSKSEIVIYAEKFNTSSNKIDEVIRKISIDIYNLLNPQIINQASNNIIL